MKPTTVQELFDIVLEFGHLYPEANSYSMVMIVDGENDQKKIDQFGAFRGRTHALAALLQMMMSVKRISDANKDRYTSSILSGMIEDFTFAFNLGPIKSDSDFSNVTLMDKKGN